MDFIFVSIKNFEYRTFQNYARINLESLRSGAATASSSARAPCFCVIQNEAKNPGRVLASALPPGFFAAAAPNDTKMERL
jgi:hypothetical protein